MDARTFTSIVSLISARKRKLGCKPDSSGLPARCYSRSPSSPRRVRPVTDWPHILCRTEFFTALQRYFRFQIFSIATDTRDGGELVARTENH
jgi:hypothetical protein